MAKDFEQLSHTADIKIRVYGSTLKDLFRNAVIGMFQVIHPIVQGCHLKDDRLVCDQLPIARDVSISSIDVSALLVDFLSEALYLSDVHDEAYLDATIIALDSTAINATLHGIKISGFEGVEIKAVTYHDLQVKEIEGEWQADIVFDI